MKHAGAGINDLLDRYGVGAPRYTSYPSAAHFQENFSVSLAKQNIRDIPDNKSISIYLHIPFCRALCHYCGCFTRVVHDDVPIRRYLDLLEKEIELAGRISGRRFHVRHVHFGGGSPNLLCGEDVKHLLGLIDLSFGSIDDAEIAMEADPRQLSAEKTKEYAGAGINRVSLGAQDFNEDTQEAVNRVQPFAMIETRVKWLRDAGIKNINFDLIYGLPFQTPESLAENARKAASLNVDRVALFGYAHVPWMRPHQKNLEKYGLPDASARYAQEQAARAAFLDRGYVPIGMDHFALPDDPFSSAQRAGQLHRNFQGYTTDQSDTLLAFGLSAISRLPKAYIQNTSSLKFYRENIEKNILPVEKGLSLSVEDGLRADIIERLMCYFTVDAGEVCKLHGFPPGFVDESLRKIKAMEQGGVVETDGRVVNITNSGRYFVRSVCAGFDVYIENEGKRYAKAV